jgi:hypothetical protein
MLLIVLFACAKQPVETESMKKPVQNLQELPLVKGSIITFDGNQVTLEVSEDTKPNISKSGDVAIELSSDIVQQQIDINGDGKADVFNDYKVRDDSTKALIHKRVDLNWDGHADIEQWFDLNGELLKEAFDGDFDGIAEWVDHYKGNQLSYSEVDTDYDGKPDLWRYYENKQLRRKEHDTNGDGKTDFWQYFDDDGVLKKTGRDTDGDGIMDSRD